jgi:actin-like ATPase involved in cell morphogenesis
MPADGYQLGIDFGTSNTVAVIRWPDGRARSLIFEGSPLLPSAVYLEPDGRLVVGGDAVQSSRLDPGRFEPNPKRHIDEGTLLLGERDVPVVEVIAAVLGRVADEWQHTVGAAQPRVTLTCPAVWGLPRRSVLVEAAGRVGFTEVRLVAEPVAAATYFAQVLGRDVPIGSVVVVHDFGAGTFDASVVARTFSGFDVLAVDGRDDIGGLDVDAAMVAHLRQLYADRAGWERLDQPSTVEDRRAKRLLWDDVRAAKERLSRHPTADLVVPLVDVDVHLTRDELEVLARPLLEQTVRVTRGVIRWANLAPGRLAGVFLVGGSSRIPLMATMLHRALGEPPVILEQPELVVAEGSIHAAALAMPVSSEAPGPATGVLPRIPADAWGSAGAPATPGVAPVSPAPPDVSAASPAVPVTAPVPPASVPVSPAAVTVAAGAAGAAPSAPAAPDRSVGRVIVPGGQPPNRSRAAAPLAPTRELPRIDQPAPPPVASPAPRPSATPRSPAAPARNPTTAPARTPPRPVQPGGYRPASGYRRSSGRFRRAVARLLIALLLIVVPVAALVVAYYLTAHELPDLSTIFGQQ